MSELYLYPKLSIKMDDTFPFPSKISRDMDATILCIGRQSLRSSIGGLELWMCRPVENEARIYDLHWGQWPGDDQDGWFPFGGHHVVHLSIQSIDLKKYNSSFSFQRQCPQITLDYPLSPLYPHWNLIHFYYIGVEAETSVTDSS